MPYLPNGTFAESIEEYKIRLAKKKDTKMKILARWESKRGKHWVEAIQYDDDVMYGLPLFGFRAVIADDILAGRSPSIGGAIQSNIRKAQRLLELGDVEGKSVACRMLEVFPQGPKVHNFALNLSGNNSAVTVDTHAAQAAFNDPLLVITLKWPIYNIIAMVYKEVAAEVGLQASEFQAVIWHTWKRMYPRMDKYFLRRKWA